MADQPGVLRFGVFEVHLAAGELRKNGSRVKLQEQPFQVLVTLLKRPGEIVTREELKEKLWAGDTFVDFDHSLSTAVNKIREVLTRWSAVASQASAGHGLDTESR